MRTMDNWDAALLEVDQCIADAERRLRVARRAKLLIKAGRDTGSLRVPGVPGGMRPVDRTFPFSQAWSLADRSTP